MPGQLVVEHGLVLTMDPARRVIRDGAVAVEGERIAAVGRRREVREQIRADEVVDAGGGIIMPGFVCSHTHLYGILLRGAHLPTAPPTDFTQNLQRIWWPVDEALSSEDAAASALVASLELLRTGTTTFADTYSGPKTIAGVLDTIAASVESTGARALLGFEATQRHSEEEGFAGLRESLRFLQRRRRGRVRGWLPMHASFTVADELLREAVAHQKQHHALLTLHTNEGLGDVHHNLERYGKRTVERLRDIGALGSRTVLAHCVHLSPEEIGLIKETRTRVAHNPLSNMLNAVGVAPIPDLLRHGVTVGLGNDGYVFNVFENLRAAYLVHKLDRRDPRVLSADEVVAMATVEGARSLGLEREVGSLEPGKQADVITLRGDALPTPLTPDSVYGHVVNSLDGTDVQHVLVGGEVVVRNGEPTWASWQLATRRARRAADALWRRLKKARTEVDVLPLRDKSRKR